MSIRITWKQPGNRKAMAREIVAAYKLRIHLMGDGEASRRPKPSSPKRRPT